MSQGNKNKKKSKSGKPSANQKAIPVNVDSEVAETIQSPLFSVIVLCYKNTNLLYGMLNTILSQSYPRIQLIISDDASADFNVEAIQKYIEERKTDHIEDVLVLKNQKNMGTVKHIDKVLRKATGEYVIFTAADDRFNHNDVISSFVADFHANPDAKWLVGRCCITNTDYKQTIYVTPTDADAAFFEEGHAQKLFSRWSRRGMAIPCCMAFKREAFDLVGGIDMDYRYLEDWPLVLKLLRNGYAPIYHNKTIACHSVGGVTNSNDRYGIEIRKAFYDDKYLIFRKEVKPYQNLISPEDNKARKRYMKEIMDRNYFLDIHYQGSRGSKLKAALKKPRNFFWALEFEFMKHSGKIPYLKMVGFAQILFLLSFFFLQFEGMIAVELTFRILGFIDLIVGLVLLIAGIVAYPPEQFYKHKAKVRRELVN